MGSKQYTYCYNFLPERPQANEDEPARLDRELVCIRGGEKRTQSLLASLDHPWTKTRLLMASNVGLSGELEWDGTVNMTWKNGKGFQMMVWDEDTSSDHAMVFEWDRHSGLVSREDWRREFVTRRYLRMGDEVGFHLSNSGDFFRFKVLKRGLE